MVLDVLHSVLVSLVTTSGLSAALLAILLCRWSFHCSVHSHFRVTSIGPTLLSQSTPQVKAFLHRKKKNSRYLMSPMHSVHLSTIMSLFVCQLIFALVCMVMYLSVVRSVLNALKSWKIFLFGNQAKFPTFL